MFECQRVDLILHKGKADNPDGYDEIGQEGAQEFYIREGRGGRWLLGFVYLDPDVNDDLDQKCRQSFNLYVNLLVQMLMRQGFEV